MTDRPLEPSRTELRRLLDITADYVVDVLDRLPDAPVTGTGPIPGGLGEPPPRTGRPLEDLLATVDAAAALGLNTSSPGYFAFIPGSGLVSAALADLVADVLNRYTALAFPAPALVALEAGVLRWLGDLFGLPAGVLTTGGSMANLSGLVSARAAKLPADFLRGTLYVTGQTHQSVAKAARIAGFPADAVRTVPTEDLRMDVAALRAAIEADRAAGRQPFCVVASAGTTNTGVVDPLPAIADVAAAEGLWLHVDAAYGGFFQLTDRGRAALRGIERADSLALDAHKGFFLPFGTGCLLVRDGEALRRGHTGPDADYLQDIETGDLPDFAHLSPELTRPFRGLRMWLPLHLHGTDAFRDALDEKLDLARYAYARLSAAVVIPAEPELSTVAFHHPDGDDATEALLTEVNAGLRVRLSSTRIGGRYVARLCVLNHRTDRSRVDEAVDAILSAATRSR